MGFAAVTVIALGVGLSESTYVVKADSTVTIASTDDSVNTGAASKKTSLYATSTDNSGTNENHFHLACKISSPLSCPTITVLTTFKNNPCSTIPVI